jgi:hypothetical protein
MSEAAELTPTGFRILQTSGQEYYRAEVAARLAKRPLHPESLARLYRISGPSDEDRSGLKLGRTIFFSAAHMKALGYPLKEEYDND